MAVTAFHAGVRGAARTPGRVKRRPPLAAGRPPRLCRAAGDAVLLELGVQGGTLHPEQGLRAVGPAHAAFGTFHDVAQIPLLKLGERWDIRDGLKERGRAIGGLMRVGRGSEHEIKLPGIIQDDRTLNLVFEFAHVAGPVVCAQAAQLLRRERQGMLVVTAGEIFDEGLHEAGDVLPAPAQGRDGQGDYGDAVQQVFTEPPLPYLFPQIAVGCGHEPEPGEDFPRATQTHEALILKNPQELGLDERRDFAHFVDKERTLIGKLEEADFLPDGPGERAALIAEEFALEKGFRHTRRMHHHKRPAPQADLVDAPGHDFLAYAGFAEDEHGGVGYAYPLGLFEGGAQALPNDREHVAVFLAGNGKKAILLLAGFFGTDELKPEARPDFRREQAGQIVEQGRGEVLEHAAGEGAVHIKKPRIGLAHVEGEAQPLMFPVGGSGRLSLSRSHIANSKR